MTGVLEAIVIAFERIAHGIKADNWGEIMLSDAVLVTGSILVLWALWDGVSGWLSGQLLKLLKLRKISPRNASADEERQ